MTTVLIVDDDVPLRKAVARIARGNGFETIQAGNGHEALAVLAESEIDVIVSDIEMPGMDGVELLRNIAQEAVDVPVILMTGNPTVETAIEAVGRGAFEYVTKPFEPARLRELIKRAAHLRAVARLRRQALSISGLPGGRAEDFESLSASFDEVIETLWMAYQPIVTAPDGAVFGHEALLRSSVSALPHPGAVLHAAEYLDRLNDLGRTVRARAPEPVVDAPERGKLFVNLHADDLLDETLFDGDAPLSRMADRVVLEITERADLHRVGRLKEVVARLREMGFSIAVDDLGAGYAGLTSFATLRPEFAKLDMSLIRGVDTDPLRRKLIASMVEVGGDLDIGIIAEGVETAEERDTLVDVGVTLFQGYLFAKPDRPFPDVTW